MKNNGFYQKDQYMNSSHNLIKDIQRNIEDKLMGIVALCGMGTKDLQCGDNVLLSDSYEMASKNYIYCSVTRAELIKITK